MMAIDRHIIRPWYWPTKQFGWQLVLLFPWFIPLVTWLLLGARYLTHWPTFVGATLLNTLIGIVCQLLLDLFTKRITARYPELAQTRKRLSLLLLAFMVITPTIILGALWVYGKLNLFGYVPQAGIGARILAFNVVANLISVGAYESIYSLTRWRENMLEKEQLKKINLQSQYESLKNQVNPHFLFNTLNSLSSLIADEPDRAEQFVDEMAKVYRYLLQTNRGSGVTAEGDGELTTLETELTFIHSYFHLLKTRYGSGIQLDIAVDEADHARLLPPLTLQMLVENAVKHNIIQATKPLVIEIKSVANEHLLIRNNLQRKATHVLSNQVGLTNIQAKYRLLAQWRTTPSDILIDDADDYFTIVLPLLNQMQL